MSAFHPIPDIEPLSPNVQADYAFSTGGGVHVPLRIEGAFFLGQYIRSIGRKSPFGAGNQFASLSAPGDSFWK
jgi:hypothetical protein